MTIYKVFTIAQLLALVTFVSFSREIKPGREKISSKKSEPMSYFTSSEFQLSTKIFRSINWKNMT